MNVSIMAVGRLVDHVGNEVDLAAFGRLHHVTFTSYPAPFSLATKFETHITRIENGLLGKSDFFYFYDILIHYGFF